MTFTTHFKRLNSVGKLQAVLVQSTTPPPSTCPPPDHSTGRLGGMLWAGERHYLRGKPLRATCRETTAQRGGNIISIHQIFMQIGTHDADVCTHLFRDNNECIYLQIIKNVFV